MTISLVVAQVNGPSNGNSDGYVEILSGGPYANGMPSMSWGPHQQRICRGDDDDTYPTRVIAYPFPLSGSNSGGSGIDYGAKVMTLGSGSTHDTNNDWAVTAQIPTQDDFYLLRDPNATNRFFLIAWPSGIPTIYSSADNYTVGSVIPGVWQNFAGSTARHYGGAAISPTGDILLQVSVGLDRDQEFTAQTAIDYIVGKFDTNGNVFRWGDQKRIQIGERYAYPCLFVKPRADMPGIYNISRRDVFKTLSPYGRNETTENYVFDGHGWRNYGTSEVVSFSETTTAIEDPLALTRTGTARFEMNHSMVAKDGYTLVMDYLTRDGASFAYMAQGFYLTVYDKKGKRVQNKLFCSNMVNYGDGKFIQDSYGRIFYLLAARGTTTCEVYLYSITQSSSSFVVQSSPVNLSSGLYPYAPESLSIRVIQPNGGNELPANVVDVIFNCKNTLYDGGTYNNATAYAGGGGRILHGKLTLN